MKMTVKIVTKMLIITVIQIDQIDEKYRHDGDTSL